MSICKCGAKLQRMNSEQGRIQECSDRGRQWPCVRQHEAVNKEKKLIHMTDDLKLQK